MCHQKFSICFSFFTPAVYPTFIPSRSELPTRFSDTNKKQATKGQEDIGESPDSDVNEPWRSQPGHRNPQDEAQNSTEVGKQIQSLERNKPNMEREDKAPETFDKCLLNGSLKMDLCQLVRPKVNYLWPATSFSHNSLCIDKAYIHVFVNRAQSGLKCAWSSPQVCAAFQDERGLTSEHQLLS